MVPWLLAALTFSAGIGPDSLEAVELYGLRTIPEARVRAAVGLAAGAPMPASLEPIRTRLLAVAGVAAVDVSVVCCGERGGSLLYVGIREHGTPPLTFRSAPSGEARLAERIIALGARFDAALHDAVRRGATGEDASQGYAMSSDSALRSIQESFIDVARTDFANLVAVLRTSSEDAHRALAAQVIAYGADRKAVVAELLHASTDPSGSVRNNAIRALALLAQWAQQNPREALSIPADRFVDLLDSVSWTDRNKGVLVLMHLSADRRPSLLAQLRARALPSLVEMARWSNPGHALGPYIILARIAGVDDGEAFAAWQAGDREKVIARALASVRGAPPDATSSAAVANQQQRRSGTWSASDGRGLAVMGTWTASPDSAGTTVTGTWALTDAQGRAVVEGTWSAAKAPTQWNGAWRAIVAGRPGEYSGTFTAALDANIGNGFGDMFESAVRNVVSGTWRSGNRSGAWSIRAAPRDGAR